ncbi:glycopeptide antibiotics resistance protein [Pullulanibacillus pueri]|nr:VanZ family protein [Pullulanibacillus pueri]MBM7680732.1 glycopeptide antibiotics resistance protein [Pullulanibacillus pueri]
MAKWSAEMDDIQPLVKRRVKRFCAGLFFTYIMTLIYVTLFTYNYYVYGKSFNLVFFDSIKLMLNSGDIWLILKNILGNVVLFFPFGFLAPTLFHHLRYFSSCFTISLLTSVVIETCQFEFAERIFDVDDIALNTVGAIFGWIFFHFVYKLFTLVFRKGRGGA